MRAFFIITILLLFLACVAGAGGVVLTTRDWMLAMPLIIASLAPARMLRWAMVWLSTPEERKLFARGMEHEPLLSLLRDMVRWKFDNQDRKVNKRDNG